jgi:CDP-6-deoxy-D-xylo-4-hexulose-3-dehydrase
MAEHSRINSNIAQRFWYPLSVATYDADEVMEAIDSMCSFRTSMWDKTREFEDAFGAQFGGEAIMVNSGSSADLLIAFSLLEESGGPLRAGDEIIVPAVTWPTQLWSALMAGFDVRLADVSPGTLNIDFDTLESCVTEKTRALSLVHLMGNPSDMTQAIKFCRDHDLVLIEDCCEALGAKWRGQQVGTFGHASAFSFFFSHHMTTMEGGMIMTSDSGLAERFRTLRAHGWSRNLRNGGPAIPGLDPRYTFVGWGFNVRPTELQAGFGLVQLGRLPGFARNRTDAVRAFRDEICGISEYVRLMDVAPEAECSWFALPMMVEKDSPLSRDDITNYLEAQGVETRPIVAGNLLAQPAVAAFSRISSGKLAGSEAIHTNGFYIGLHPTGDLEPVRRVGNLIAELFRKATR